MEAAIAWRSVLLALQARVIATEIWLEGMFGEIPIHGQADTVLKLPDGRLLVVDFKKSSSPSRKARMVAGYDSQADLYRTMIRTGGPKGEQHAALREEIKNAPGTDILYFMMNDKAVLADTVAVAASRIPGWTALDNDVSVAALACIQERVAEVRQGLVRINTDADEAFFDKQARVTPYALDVSPLIRLFMRPSEGEK